MKETSKLSALRSTATLTFALMLCLATFIPSPFYINPRDAHLFCAVLAGSVLGGFSGAGAAGIYIIAGISGLKVFLNGERGWKIFTGEYAGFIWGLFIASIISGLIAGIPLETEKKVSLKTLLVLAAASIAASFSYLAAGAAFYYRALQEFPPRFMQTALWNITISLASVPFSAFIRPAAAKILYPSDKVNREIEEFLRKNKSRKH